MKRLSDYQGAEAFELWADIFEPAMAILNDEDVKKHTTGENIDVWKACMVVMQKHSDEAIEILNRLDPDDPITGAGALPAVANLLVELIAGDSARGFFRSSEPEKPGGKSSGSATENTEDGEK